LSDARLKENVKDLKVDYKVLDSIRAVSFNWKDFGKSAYGFIAQELEEVMPELVNENEETSYKSVSYVQLIPHLLEAIKDLKKRIDELEEKR
jgi:flagellar capping protein FliD